MTTCVVTGGAGFIGCAISKGLSDRFDRVVVLDKLHPQIHSQQVRPAALDARVEFRHADVVDPETWTSFLDTGLPDTVVHLAAETGTAQSLSLSSRHSRENVLGTTVMLDAFSARGHVPKQIVLSSSRAIYGEGAWRHNDGNIFYPGQRDREQLARGEWDFPNAAHIPFSAGKNEPRPTSIYGATKLCQEHILEAWSLSYGSNLTICRLQNVYGPGQSLINSYTGIVSLFVRLARENKCIPLYEDGEMLRDFIYIDDIADALLASIDRCPAGTNRFDIGTGGEASIARVANVIADRYNSPRPYVSAAYRQGDVRHASCDINATLAALPWRPKWSLEDGLEGLSAWIDLQMGPR